MPPNPYVDAMTRDEMLAELRGWRDRDGLDYVARRDGGDHGPHALSDDELRKIAELLLSCG